MNKWTSGQYDIEWRIGRSKVSWKLHRDGKTIRQGHVGKAIWTKRLAELKAWIKQLRELTE